MKIITPILALASLWVAGCASPTTPPATAKISFDADVRKSEIIAVVSVGQVVGRQSTDAAGRSFSTYTTEAKLERALKGNPPAEFRIQEEVVIYQPTPDDPFRLKAPKSVMVSAGQTSRWLVFLKRTANGYTATDAQTLCSVYGTGPGSRVIWRSVCLSMEQAEEIINKRLAMK